ncbi:MAG: radical SAM protein [Deltaproteobacteria bacterium]|nr:radical SAM protein [Deltaproteobacteria bacterium]
MRKRVLFINPCKNDYFTVGRMHMGQTLLGGMLKHHGHEVVVMDYAFLRGLRGKIRVPEIEEVIESFKPDVIGITVFTYVYDECLSIIERVSDSTAAPIILGGPHFIMFPDDFGSDRRVSYTVRGEAEGIIKDLVATAKKGETPVSIDCTLPSPQEIPAVNLDIAYGNEFLSDYQIQLSRGCPFDCSFCNVKMVAGRKVRLRDLSLCVRQIVEAKKRYPNIRTISITDDVPTINKNRFKEFLKMFKDADLHCQLTVDNVRADLIDEEMIELYVSAGGQNICLGVESGHPEVFELTHKGETLEKIAGAARLIKKHGLTLGMCFVIGLPEDNLERHMASLQFAKTHKADYAFWNMCVPWPGTDVRAWYGKNGSVGELRNFSTLIDPQGNYQIPPAFTAQFPVEDRVKAWLMSNMATYWFEFGSLKKIASEAVKYKLYRSLIIFVFGKVFHLAKMRIFLLYRNFKQFGFYFVLTKVLRKIKR